MQQERIFNQFQSPEGPFQLAREVVLDKTNRRCNLVFVTNKIGSTVASSLNGSATSSVADDLTPPARYIELPVADDKSSTSGFSFAASLHTASSKGSEKKAKKSERKLSKPAAVVAKIVAHENLAKILANRAFETTFMLLNTGTRVLWAEYPGTRMSEALSYISFKEAIATCIDVNMLNNDNIEAVVGFNTGEILVYSPINGKQTRFNKQGGMHKVAVTCIRWLPPRGQPDDESVFVAGFEDGSLIHFDKEKEKEDSAPQHTPVFPNQSPLFMVANKQGKGKTNPVTWWKAGKKSITAIAISPDFTHLAVAGQDGYLRIVHYASETLVETFRSFYGGITCVDWSPDGKYLLTGSQDDNVTIWHFGHRGIVARCYAHSSWVSGVAFDPYLCTTSSYRFASVGDDARLFLWEFSLELLTRPKPGKHRHRESPFLEVEEGVHPVLSRNDVSTLAPLESAGFRLHKGPICALTFLEDGLVTTDMTGLIKIWNRPPSSV
ncbi:hypothetical protein HDU89_006950 [Geranomyces variabilis]|nr:hypothetical protein HDU89_006950 [Geranomyces variabilis]